MQMAVICRISGLWLSKVVLLVSVYLYRVLKYQIPNPSGSQRWSGQEMNFYPALVCCMKKKKIKLFFCTSAQTHQTHSSSTSSSISWISVSPFHWCLLTSAFVLAAEVVSTGRFWFSERLQLPVCQQHELGQGKSQSCRVGRPWTRAAPNIWWGQWWFSSAHPGAAFWWSFNYVNLWLYFRKNILSNWAWGLD